MPSSKEVQEAHLRNVFRFDGYRVELESRRLVSPENEELSLRPRAFEILVYLLRNADRVISKDELLDRFWPGTVVEESAVTHCISEIREVLGDHPEQPLYIRTIPKVGYQFIAPVTRVFPVPYPSFIEAAEEASSGDSMSQSTGVSVEQSAKRWRRILPWSLAALLAVIATVSLFLLWRSMQQQPHLVRSAITLPAGHRFGLWPSPPLSLSPDGRFLVYAAEHEGQRQLFLRSLEEFRTRPISGTEGASAPFFSPDGDWIGFLAEGSLQKVPVAGGPPVEICPSQGGGTTGGASWGPDGTIVYSPRFQSPLWLKTDGGGPPEQITRLDQEMQETHHRWPEILPGGGAVLFTLGTLTKGYQIALLSLETLERKVLVEEGSGRPQYIPTGHMIYGLEGRLLAVPFDLKQHRVTGSPVAVQAEVFMHGGMPYFSVSTNGTLAYVPGNADKQLVKVDREGNTEPLLEYRANYLRPRLSPDGKRVAVRIVLSENRNGGMWIYDLDSGKKTRQPESGLFPAWTPNGKHLIWMNKLGVGPEAQRRIVANSADGSGDMQVLLEDGGLVGSVSPDGKFLAFTKGGDIWILPLEGDDSPWRFLSTSSAEFDPKFSPDGSWLAYASNESGQEEVHVKPFPGPGNRSIVSVDGGSRPKWSADGRELFYLRNDHQFFAVPVTTEPVLNAGKPQPLFERTCNQLGWDVFPDGQHFVLVQTPEKPTQINIVQSWTEELKRLVPTDN